MTFSLASYVAFFTLSGNVGYDSVAKYDAKSSKAESCESDSRSFRWSILWAMQSLKVENCTVSNSAIILGVTI